LDFIRNQSDFHSLHKPVYSEKLSPEEEILFQGEIKRSGNEWNKKLYTQTRCFIKLLQKYGIILTLWDCLH